MNLGPPPGDVDAVGVGVGRAREILGSLKEQREFFSGVVRSSRENSHRQHASGNDDVPSESKPVAAARPSAAARAVTAQSSGGDCGLRRRPPLFTPEEKEMITRQLKDSLRERKNMLRRMSRQQQEGQQQSGKQQRYARIPRSSKGVVVGAAAAADLTASSPPPCSGKVDKMLVPLSPSDGSSATALTETTGSSASHALSAASSASAESSSSSSSDGDKHALRVTREPDLEQEEISPQSESTRPSGNAVRSAPSSESGARDDDGDDGDSEDSTDPSSSSSTEAESFADCSSQTDDEGGSSRSSSSRSGAASCAGSPPAASALSRSADRAAGARGDAHYAAATEVSFRPVSPESENSSKDDGDCSASCASSEPVSFYEASASSLSIADVHGCTRSRLENNSSSSNNTNKDKPESSALRPSRPRSDQEEEEQPPYAEARYLGKVHLAPSSSSHRRTLQQLTERRRPSKEARVSNDEEDSVSGDPAVPWLDTTKTATSGPAPEEPFPPESFFVRQDEGKKADQGDDDCDDSVSTNSEVQGSVHSTRSCIRFSVYQNSYLKISFSQDVDDDDDDDDDSQEQSTATRDVTEVGDDHANPLNLEVAIVKPREPPEEDANDSCHPERGKDSIDSHFRMLKLNDSNNKSTFDKTPPSDAKKGPSSSGCFRLEDLDLPAPLSTPRRPKKSIARSASLCRDGDGDGDGDHPRPGNAAPPPPPLSPAGAAADRAAYFDELYSSPAGEAAPSRSGQRSRRLRRRERRRSSRNETKANGGGAESSSSEVLPHAPLLGFSVVVDDDARRREMLASLRRDAGELASCRVEQDERRAEEEKDRDESTDAGVLQCPSSPISLSEDDDIYLSDVSSFECTEETTSTSGWESSTYSSTVESFLAYRSDEDDETLLLMYDSDCVEDEANVSLLSSVLPTLAEEDEVETGSDSDDDGGDDEEDDDPEQRQPSPGKKLSPTAASLFVTEEVADRSCRACGGMFSIAKRSASWSDRTRVNSERPRASRTENTAEAASPLRLSADFRCGARGSLYDIASRSGRKVAVGTKANEPETGKGKGRKSVRRKRITRREPDVEREERFCAARGGFYDTALRSGLDRSSLRSRRRSRSLTAAVGCRRSGGSSIAPECVSDQECGATGESPCVAIQTDAAYYATLGSLYYIAERSGFKL